MDWFSQTFHHVVSVCVCMSLLWRSRWIMPLLHKTEDSRLEKIFGSTARVTHGTRRRRGKRDTVSGIMFQEIEKDQAKEGLELSTTRVKSTWFLSGGRDWLDLSIRNRNWLGCSVGIDRLGFFVGMHEIDFFFRLQPENDLAFGIKMDLVFAWVVELDLIFVHRPKYTWFLWSGSKWTWFLCGWWKSSGFLCSAGTDVVLVRGMILLLVVWAVEIDACFVCGPKMTWFFVWGIEIDLIFAWVVEIALFFVCRPKMTWFSSGGSKMTWFLCRWSQNWLGCFVSGRNWLGC